MPADLSRFRSFVRITPGRLPPMDRRGPDGRPCEVGKVLELLNLIKLPHPTFNP